MLEGKNVSNVEFCIVNAALVRGFLSVSLADSDKYPRRSLACLLCVLVLVLLALFSS